MVGAQINPKIRNSALVSRTITSSNEYNKTDIQEKYYPQQFP